MENEIWKVDINMDWAGHSSGILLMNAKTRDCIIFESCDFSKTTLKFCMRVQNIFMDVKEITSRMERLQRIKGSKLDVRVLCLNEKR